MDMNSWMTNLEFWEPPSAYCTFDRVNINGVTWATSNISEQPGTFVSSRTEYGGYYTFDEAQKVCPSGFHVPTKKELETLFDEDKVSNEWVTNFNGSGVNGRLF